MKKILIIGAGRSSANLIRYLLEHAEEEKWKVRVGDMDVSFAGQKIGNSPHGEAIMLDASDANQRRTEIAASDLVISMLPASMHILVANDCIELGKPVITPSYVSDEMWQLDKAARERGVLLLNEMGVDPGIDHMSAMKIIDELQSSESEILSFESFTGGLIAPESDNNPWNYKVTWNPRNVILAGYGGTAKYRRNNEFRFIPYHRLFTEITHVNIAGHGDFEGYANRDSLKYASIYNLENIPTLYRGTLRKSGFCAAWNALVQLGLTDDSFQLENAGNMSWKQLTGSFIEFADYESPEAALLDFTGSLEVTSKLIWLGILEEKPLNMKSGSPAVALQKLIEEKWKLDENDKDMIVMWHRFRYRKGAQTHEIRSSLVTTGDDPVYTAMSKTVGLPMAIAAKMILNGTMKLTGVHLPVIPEIYEPIMKELEQFGIIFTETDSLINE